MIYHIDDIAKDVRISLDMNSSSDMLAQINDTDTLSLNEIIKSKIIEGVKNVHCLAPAHLLDNDVSFSYKNNIYWKEKECGWIILPEDFMRFISFKMDDWNHAVHNALSPDSPEYKMQSSRFKGLRGTSQKPLCFIVPRPEGRALEFYSCKSTDAKISQSAYIPYPTIDDNGGITISEHCYKAAIYNIASLVLMTIGEMEKSQFFNELSKTTLI